MTASNNDDFQNIGESLLDWYDEHARDLPWRQTRDPYKIWVAEIMLQQTQVARVIEYYQRFLARFPTVFVLAEANWDDFLPSWRGLGFYSRGKNMLRTAELLVQNHNGVFPKNLQLLQQFPGVGPYTAAAIMSFAFEVPIPAIDTNLERVLGRVFGCTHKGVIPRADALFAAVSGNAHSLNHALMDLGSTLCTGRKVICEACPLASRCHFFTSGKKDIWEQGLLRASGIRQKKSPKIPMEVAVACIHRNGKYLIAKRSAAKGGSWEFPGGKREKGEDWRHALKREIQEELGVEISARPHFFEKTWEEGDYLWRLRFARCQILHGEPIAYEHDALRWVFPEEILHFDFPVANIEAVEILKKMKG